MADTVIVPPMYNEIEHLERAVGRIRHHAPQVYLLIVDDASPDGMGELAEKLAAVDPGLAVMQRATEGRPGRDICRGV